MKRTIFAFALFFSLFSTLSAEEKLFSFSVGPESGLAFYGDNQIKTDIKALDGSRFLVGALADINVNPFKQVTFFAGADLLCDFVKDKPYYSNHLHLDFPFGIKVYPGIGGLCAGVAYTLGIRYDYVNTFDSGEYKSSSAWGNGCKFLLEYNFAHDSRCRYYPTIGASWKYIPRGSSTFDNLISAYILLNF